MNFAAGGDFPVLDPIMTCNGRVESRNLRQKKELTGLREKAKKTGVTKVYIDDLTREFVTEYIFPSLKAGALYEHAYPLATSLGRPLLAKMLVEVARKEKATMVAH